MKTILIIDDDPLCRQSAAALLRQRAWEVIEAADGEEGLALALEKRPHIILCDLLMPRANGFHLCRSVRAQSELQHIPLLVMSGRDYAADRQSAFEAGACEYLVKPIGGEALHDALERHLPPAAPALPSQDEPPEGALPETTVRFWGVRGSIPTPGPSTILYGGNTSCVEVRADGELVVLDAGTGIRGLGLALMHEYAGRPIHLTLLVSHTHWDHIQGFPFFAPAYGASNQLRILGYEGASASLAATLAGQMESPYFPIPLKQMPGNLNIEELREMRFQVGPIPATACFSKHPGVCVGYRLQTRAGSIAYVPDNEWSAEDAAALSDDSPCASPNALLDFVRGADVLIIDAQYDAEEYHSHIGWGHGCVDDVVRLGLKAGVGHLYLFHHDPAHDDAYISGMVDRARELVRASGSTMPVDAAREGAEVILRAQARG